MRAACSCEGAASSARWRTGSAFAFGGGGAFDGGGVSGGRSCERLALSRTIPGDLPKLSERSASSGSGSGCTATGVLPSPGDSAASRLGIRGERRRWPGEAAASDLRQLTSSSTSACSAQEPHSAPRRGDRGCTCASGRLSGGAARMRCESAASEWALVSADAAGSWCRSACSAAAAGDGNGDDDGDVGGGDVDDGDVVAPPPPRRPTGDAAVRGVVRRGRGSVAADDMVVAQTRKTWTS